MKPNVFVLSAFGFSGLGARDAAAGLGRRRWITRGERRLQLRGQFAILFALRWSLLFFLGTSISLGHVALWGQASAEMRERPNLITAGRDKSSRAFREKSKDSRELAYGYGCDATSEKRTCLWTSASPFSKPFPARRRRRRWRPRTTSRRNRPTAPADRSSTPFTPPLANATPTSAGKFPARMAHIRVSRVDAPMAQREMTR